jgi:hypothetical protein
MVSKLLDCEGSKVSSKCAEHICVMYNVYCGYLSNYGEVNWTIYHDPSHVMM